MRAAGQSPPQPGPELRLAAGVFDPVLEAASSLLSHRLMMDAYPADVEGYYIVQFDGPILPGWKAALESSGARILDYIPDFSFVVKMDAQARAVVEALPHVRWVGLYQPGFRLEPSLFDGVLPAEAVTGQLLVVVFPGEDVDLVVEQLEALGGEVLDVSRSHWKSKLKLEIDPARAVQVAAINGVRWVGPVPEFKLANSRAADIMGVRPAWQDHGLYGAGQVVAVCDTGLDQGSTNPANLHDDFEDGNGHSRVIALYDRSGDGAGDVSSGHGTHVAGSVLGNGDLSGASPAIHTFPSSSYVGMAPDAKLVFQAVGNNNDSLVGIPLDLTDLFTQTYTHGARIHSNSWAGGIYGSYSSYSQDVDEFVWDNPDFLPLFAAANEGIDANADGVIDLDSVLPPSTAKNCVTVGATENDRPSGSTPTPGYNFAWGTGSWAVLYPANPVNSDHVSDDPDGMAAFSSRGPTLDGRYKPDVVAPGTNVASVRSSMASGTGWGTIDANYMFMGGTSMATPLAAGGTALIREWYTRTQWVTPSAALMKATLVNGAFDVYPGQYGTGATQEITPTVPNNVEGWGRVDIQASIFPTAPRSFQYVDERGGLDTNQVYTYTFEVVTDSVPLRANLVWSDYPGAAAAAGGLVNDLDLTLYGPGEAIFYPTNGVQRGASQHLFYDDWGASGGYTGVTGNRVAVRFTPTSYPVTVDKGLFFVASVAGSFPKTFTYFIFDDDGTGGRPGSILASGSTTIRRGAWPYPDWHVVDLSGHNVTITGGDFYLAIQLPDTDLAWSYDNTAPIDGRSWGYDGSSWSNWTGNDYMFQAVVRGNDPLTGYDRVNNVVGVHVPTTTLQTGYYTLTVRGYNVPQGPQPYALAFSGGLTAGCVQVTGVDLSLVTTGDIYTDTNVQFSADVAPDNAVKPYTYTIAYDDGTAPVTGAGSDDPLALHHTFATTGTHSVEIAVWNCDMTEAEAVTGTAVAVVSPGCEPISNVQLSRMPAGDLFTGNTVRFTADADGSTPFTYTWTLDSTPVGANWSTFERIFDTAGTYTVGVTVTNRCGLGDETTVVEMRDPAPDQPDLSKSYKSVNLTSVESGDVLTYTLLLRNGSVVTATAILTDPIPVHTTWITGSAWASDGTTVTLAGGQLHWSGQVISGTPVVVEFSVEVQTAPEGTPITNVAHLDDGLGNVVLLEAHSTYNPGYGLTINEGALYTNVPTVTLRFSWNADDDIMHVRISNDGGFGPAGDTTDWMAVNPADPTYTDWVLATCGELRLPRMVYVKFRDSGGLQRGPIQDDIIYDPGPPQVTGVEVITQAVQTTSRMGERDVTVRVTASDGNSGVATVRVGHSADCDPFSEFAVTGGTTDIPWTLQLSGEVYVRVVDRAGNLSQVSGGQGPVLYRIYLPLVMKVTLSTLLRPPVVEW